ncbi:MAG: ArsR/SmtB family transcription factor [Gammaproteobacteria bacterium]|jgi:ArsR family transcriptional regulator, nickel/cobalt-responsive transcriptional repressor
MTSLTTICSKRLKVLADATRLAIVRQLMRGPQTVHAINQQIAVEQSLLSHHLKVLRDARLVTATRDGKSMIYGLAPDVSAASTAGAINLGCCKLSFP